MPHHTLSLAQIADLAHVKREVVTMWRNRPLAGHPFPGKDSAGRFDATEMIEYLEATGRGNNPDARVDLALQTVMASDVDADQLRALLALVAARSISQAPLSALDAEDLLDLVDDIDADDEWLWSELEHVDVEGLAPMADSLVDAAWNLADAHDRLVEAIASREPDDRRPGPDLLSLLTVLTKALLEPGSCLVDVAGTASDVVAELLRDEDLPEIPLVLPVCGGTPRLARQRLEVRDLHPRVVATDDDWGLAPRSVALVWLPRGPQAAFDLLEELSLNLADDTLAVVLGPAAVLVDELASDERRDALVRDGLVHTVVRLPQGLLRHGVRGHLGLWLMSRGDRAEVHVGDVSSRRLGAHDLQALLDDLVAAARADRRRAYEFLHRTSLPALLTARSLVSLGHTIPAEVAPSAGDEAARIHRLVASLAEPFTNPTDALTPRVATHGARPATVALGEASRALAVRVLSGTRLDDVDALPSGSTRVWTADSLRTGRPATSVDLLSLTRLAPKAVLTQPDDVVFCPVGSPSAVVDAVGGAAVLYPARVLRVSKTASLSPRAIAATIGALPAGSGSWRGWQVPVASARAAGEDTLRLLDEWEQQLTDRQNVVDELRQVVIRSVLSGAVEVTRTSPEIDEKGQ